jgi:hypothetical protein
MSTRTAGDFAVSGRLKYLAVAPDSIGREADVTRTWFSVIAAGALAGACAEPNPPPAAPAATASPAATVPAATGVPAEPVAALQSDPGLPRSPIVGTMPPSTMNANPPGTPAYVIHPGDPAGQQLPRPGGAPAF